MTGLEKQVLSFQYKNPLILFIVLFSNVIYLNTYCVNGVNKIEKKNLAKQ